MIAPPTAVARSRRNGRPHHFSQRRALAALGPDARRRVLELAGEVQQRAAILAPRSALWRCSAGRFELVRRDGWWSRAQSSTDALGLVGQRQRSRWVVAEIALGWTEPRPASMRALRARHRDQTHMVEQVEPSDCEAVGAMDWRCPASVRVSRGRALAQRPQVGREARATRHACHSCRCRRARPRARSGSG